MKPALIVATLLFLIPNHNSARQIPGGGAIELRTGMVITSSMSVKPKTYRLRPSDSPDSAAITIRGDNIAVDFAGATIQGIDADADPDSARGVAIFIDGGENVRILNAKIR